jgi:hypothetical protein
MKWKVICLLIVLVVFAGLARAQTGALFLQGAGGASVDLGGRLKKGAANAAANTAALNDVLRSNQSQTLLFPAGDWYFAEDTTNSNVYGTCIQLGGRSGASLVGQGLYRPENEPGNWSQASTRLIYAGPKISLATLRLSARGATIAISGGYRVKPQDIGATVNITGGTNAVPGWFTITTVNPRAGTWTLDRACATGDTTSLAGLMTYSLLRDNGFGTNYSGLAFKGSADYAGVKCHVGIHIPPATSHLNTGKHTFMQCAFTDFTAAVMCGRDMRQAYAGGNNSYAGENDEHADLLTFIRPWWDQCRTGFYVRNSQSSGHTIIAPRYLGPNAAAECEVVYHERSGETTMIGGQFSGSNVSALRIQKSGANTAFVSVRDCSFDGATVNPHWLRTDFAATNYMRITFEGCTLDQAITHYSNPPLLFDARGGMGVLVQQCDGIRNGSIFTQRSVDYQPHFTLISNTFSDDPKHDAPGSLMVPGSAGGTTLQLLGNTNRKGTINYDDGRWIFPTGWVEGYQLPPPK